MTTFGNTPLPIGTPSKTPTVDNNNPPTPPSSLTLKTPKPSKILETSLSTTRTTPPSNWYDIARKQFAYFSENPSIETDGNGNFNGNGSGSGNGNGNGEGVPTWKPLAFMENAGGSQVPKVVVDAMCRYMKYSYAQLGAGYEMSERATISVERAHQFMANFVNSEGVGEVVLGSSTSQLVATIADCYSRVFSEDDEIIIHEGAHEANVGPWERAAKRAGCTLKLWKIDPETMEQGPLKGLEELLSEKTRIVAFAHVSNLLGEITDVEAVVKLVREKGGPKARVVVDGVAFAPHRAIDVSKWGVDWYVFSSYKVFGPHMAILFGTHKSLDEIKDEGPNHFWIDGKDSVYKFELGGVSHEGCAGILAVGQYLQLFGANKERVQMGITTDGKEESSYSLDVVSRESIVEAFEKFTQMEFPLQDKLVKYLVSKEEVIVIGPLVTDVTIKVPTISFFHVTKKSPEVSRAIQEAGFAVRHGHMYSYRLVSVLEDRLGVNTIHDGVVRVSMLHYNTLEEVDGLIEALERIL